MEAVIQPNRIIALITIIVVSVLLEAIVAYKRKKLTHQWKDSLANFFIFIGGNFLRPLNIAFAYLLFNALTPFRLFEFSNTWVMWTGAFIGVEFMYYWYHRISHEVKIFWTLHHTHHSSPWFNYSTAIRINWLDKFVGLTIYIPLILIGFSPVTITTLLVLNLIFQLFLHTELIGQLKWLEGILNTPSAHRVHHGKNEEYLDKNYGGILMIWDRIFGTYQPEKAKVVFGVTTGFIGHNPFKILFKPLTDYCKSIVYSNKNEKKNEAFKWRLRS